MLWMRSRPTRCAARECAELSCVSTADRYMCRWRWAYISAVRNVITGPALSQHGVGKPTRAENLAAATWQDHCNCTPLSTLLPMLTAGLQPQATPNLVHDGLVLLLATCKDDKACHWRHFWRDHAFAADLNNSSNRQHSEGELEAEVSRIKGIESHRSQSVCTLHMQT